MYERFCKKNCLLTLLANVFEETNIGRKKNTPTNHRSSVLRTILLRPRAS